MSRLVEFTTDDGGTVVVEVASGAGSLVTRGGDHAADHSGVFARAQQTFQRALEQVRPAVQGVIDELLSLENRPDELSVEFGIDLHAEAGAFIASASTASNFKVRLTWNKPAPTAPPK
ncbi:CU044_2847 family protein [Paenarthrobacter nicotinovorans]|uniref:CU044_2847 family protein n=1 Tax=Paenarthrobacter nicotinovorans TaxID=29320 RepID=UPI00119CA234|nr:CU044_2847 family protein [Paenarthrobacter nicotinovorans]